MEWRFAYRCSSDSCSEWLERDDGGPFAIAALMVGGVVERFAADRSGHNNSTTRTTICCQTSGLAVPPDEAIEIASTVTLLVGLWQFYICFFRRFHTIKIPCAVISVTCISLLLISNFFMDPVFRKWTNVKFPMEFVLVDAGIPPPRLPSFNGAEELVWQAVTIAIISFVIHIALAKLISKRLNYEIDANQAGAKETEWFALGAMNAIASFFSCFAGGSSLGRTMMQVKFGTRSQVHLVFSQVKSPKSRDTSSNFAGFIQEKFRFCLLRLSLFILKNL
ncbi:unnamed protein product [Nippostrongylus brasiliensis]|uniref:Sulfate_transp domain-containing protein n=1 Tax=Nippostrongylus brasiliensis TaxID=27835 RepID=A0A0N4YSQ8_NIPBR|nr:unnamed protein product [Nippostrongylus brasiliensis]